MASSSAEHKTSSGDESDEDLVQCGICMAVLNKPKALPCLHTFCEECLSSWSKQNPDKNKVSCPSCRENFTLPAGGVKKLKTNFLAIKLIERRSVQRHIRTRGVNVPCTSCPEDEASPGIAVARCVECNDFLCAKCVNVHKSVKILRQHELLTFNELRSRKLGSRNLPEQEICTKHNGEVLRFYCETCEEPMCRDCTVLDHPKPKHSQVDLISAARDRNEKLQKLAKNCEPFARILDNAIDSSEKTKNDLDAAYDKALARIKEFTSRAVTELKRSRREQEEELRQLKLKRDKEIECHRDELELKRVRIRTALETSHQVTEKGSDHDVTAMYSSLKSSMQELSSCAKPKAVAKSLGKITFVPREDLLTDLTTHKLGQLQTYTCDDSLPTCTMVLTMGLIHVRKPTSVAFNDKGYILLTDHHPNRSVLDFYGAYGGKGKMCIELKNAGEPDVTTSKAWGVAVGSSSQYFVTDLNPYIKVFDSQGNFYMKIVPRNDWADSPGADSGSGSHDGGRSSFTSGAAFAAMGIGAAVAGAAAAATGGLFGGVAAGAAAGAAAGMSGYPSAMHKQKPEPELYGITIDLKGLIYVGSDRRYINILNQDGSFVSRFRTNIYPYFIAVANGGQILLSDYQNLAVHVHDARGRYLNEFSTPEGVDFDKTWFEPTGICCTADDEVYVANKSPPGAIYRYSVFGEFLGVLTTKVSEPWGIALNEDGDRLAVVDSGGTVQVFSLV